MTMIKKITYLISGILAIFVFATVTKAATLDLVADRDTFPVNEEFYLDVKINSEGASVNGAQATLQFDPSILEVKSADKTSSIFDFWLSDPTISNAEGKVSFIAASTTGYTGQSLQILRVVFRAKGPGASNLYFTDAAITAADGNGTNVLTKVNGLSINFVVGASSTSIGQPVQIVRTAAPAVGLPVAPVVEVPLYPDPTKWNNISSRFYAKWVLPGDITAVATLINKSAESTPTKSEGLFEEKQFPPLADGTHYLHVRFRNSIGWGPALHYRIAVDTAPPSPFEISFSDGNSSDNPTPTVSYKSADSLSGISHYVVIVKGREAIETPEDFLVLLPVPPGTYSITIRAVDIAGNASQATADFEILPIASPVITSLSREVFTGEGSLFVSGASVPGNKINVTIKGEAGDVEFIGSTEVDDKGAWTISISQPLRNGRYYAEVKAEDSRGALSLPVKSDIFTVSPRPLFTVAGFGITPAMFILLLLIAIVVIVSVSMAVYRSQTLKVARRVIIAQRDVAAMANVMAANADKLLKVSKEGDIDKEELKVLIDKTKDDSARMKKYIVDNIGEIKD